jgi:hypothetical protein
MKKLVSVSLGLFLVATPAFALADAFTPLQLQVQHLTAIAAALEAQAIALQSGRSLACAAVASKTTVQVHEQFALAWGSVGAEAPVPNEAMWTQNGVQEISIDTPGTHTYSFTFFATNDATTSCTAKILVTPAQ